VAKIADLSDGRRLPGELIETTDADEPPAAAHAKWITTTRMPVGSKNAIAR
jgi:hypothetical protein